MHWLWLVLLGLGWLELETLARAALAWGDLLPDGRAVLIAFLALYGRRRELPLTVAVLCALRAVYSLEPFGGIYLSDLVVSLPWLEVRRWIPRERATVVAFVTFLISFAAAASRVLWPPAWLAGASGVDLGTALIVAAGAGLFAPVVFAALRRWKIWNEHMAKDRVFG